MEESKGVIYILTNPSFKEYVKIGYADDIEKRLQQLNRSECIPFAFRVYATYEVDSRLSDLKIHSIIDKLNPNLRSIDNFNGQKRVREFYAMSPEDAYSILEAIAEIHNRTDKLKLVEPDAEAQNDESIAEEIQTETRIRGANFTFSEWEIPIGAVLEYYKNPDIKCTVVDDRKVEYEGEIMFLTSVAKKITGKQSGIAGPRYFKYKGTELWDIEGRNS
ncbi:MAG: GIY-YIG nuclease family protein [Lachnospiraceae bacterium]|nr:GIY-YIG nuclease family protein [Lachnospiraceae bacterium]